MWKFESLKQQKDEKAVQSRKIKHFIRNLEQKKQQLMTSSQNGVSTLHSRIINCSHVQELHETENRAKLVHNWIFEKMINSFFSEKKGNLSVSVFISTLVGNINGHKNSLETQREFQTCKSKLN